MYRVRSLATIVFGGVLALGAIGCSDPKDMEIAALREEIDRLNRDKLDWPQRLAQAQDDANAARARAAQLQGELDGCLSRLASASTPRPVESPLPSGWTGTQQVAWINVAEDILFDSGKADLKTSGRSKLQQVRDQIREKFTNHNIWVVGHTDTDQVRHSKNKWTDNLDLSLARGRVVGEALLTLGIPNRDVIIGGQGEWNPLGPNDTKANKERNRRVQIIAVLKAPGSAPSVDISMRE